MEDAMQLDHLNCCGIREISGLCGYSTGAAAFKAYLRQTLRCGLTHFRYVIFSQANRDEDAGSREEYGENFAAYLRDHKLGDVIETGEYVNPNSGNLLKVWIWTVDHDAVNASRANRAKREPKKLKEVVEPSATGVAYTLGYDGQTS